MEDKKIIEKTDIKKNNPNDDEEILKNHEQFQQNTDTKEAESKDKYKKTEDSATNGIP